MISPAALLGLIVIWAGADVVTAQTPPRITSTVVSNTSINLAWTGGSVSYEVLRARNLVAPTWHPVLITAVTNAAVPMPGSGGYFRIIGLADAALPPITEARRFEILGNITSKIQSQSGTNAQADIQQMADYLATFNEFIDTGVTADTSSWARFRDGRLVVIMNNRPPANQEQLKRIAELKLLSTPALSLSLIEQQSISATSTAKTGLSSQSVSVLLAPQAIPVSRNAVMFQAAGVGLRAPALDRLVPMLENRGYKAYGGEAGLADLVNVKNLGDDIGVFYIDSHGSEADGFDYALLTSTWADAETDADLSQNFEEGELCYGFLGPALVPKDGTGISIVPKPLYAIRSLFVRKHWKFGRDSLVYIDACNSAGDLALPFIQACSDAGASVYAGWTKNANDAWALFAAQTFFGTVIGDNTYQRLTPAQRPFDLPAVKSYMHGKQYDISPGSNAELLFLPIAHNAGSRFGLLAPSIYSMHVDEDKEELHIRGSFDPDAPATVRIEGGAIKEIVAQPNFIPDANFEPMEIVCPLPARSSPSAGNVTVIQRGHQSNVVPLTEYWLKAQGKKYFTVDVPDPHSTIDFNIHLRVDLHKSRTTPYSEPIFQGNGADAARDSTGTISDASGTWTYPNGSGTLTWSLEKPVSLDIFYSGTRPDTYFQGRTSFGPATFGMTLWGFAKDALILTDKFSDGTERVTHNEPGQRFAGVASLDPTTYVIPAGTGEAASDIGILNWESASPSFAPNDQLPGYGAEPAFSK